MNNLKEDLNQKLEVKFINANKIAEKSMEELEEWYNEKMEFKNYLLKLAEANKNLEEHKEYYKEVDKIYNCLLLLKA